VKYLGVAIAFVLAACGSVAPTPQDVFMRLQLGKPKVSDAWSDSAVRVLPLSAASLYNERALVYTRDLGYSLKQSPNLLWIDNPRRMLQHAIADYLREAGIAPTVATHEHGGELLVIGHIAHFERSADAGSAVMRAAIGFVIRRVDGDRALFAKEYAHTVSIGDATPTAQAQAMSEAVAHICAEFVADSGRALQLSIAKGATR